ncbi:MAG: hypothetical protein NC429_15990 [Lachnospiraceae bacterium]|nr:hypothetical protein [Lachnospiraceae bacterium]
MMNKYIEIEMRPTACGIGGSFSAEASFCLDTFQAPFYDIDVKIDTGCSISTIPLKRLKVSDTLCKTLKKMDIMNGTSYLLSYGIESGGLRHEVPITDDEKMECPAMKFEHGISDFMIAGVKISSDRICLNYDRKGNILIGMDILKDWDIHIGVSKVTGKSLFLACPMENKCGEYIDALERHFGIS